MLKLCCILLGCMLAQNVIGKNHVVDLNIDYKQVDFAGKGRKAIAVNDQIPAPTLRFKQGDHVVLNVHNKLDKNTSIHWHGIILPWQMDGVEGISQQGIAPGKTFRYEFTLEQSGTYWYHAHAELQEQEGLYGAFLIDSSTKEEFTYNKDFVVVLSDWSNTNADQIYANLKKEGDYYAPDFALQPSLNKFIEDYNDATCQQRKAIIENYQMMQQMRMSIYDYSDVAYDAFLLNGKTKCKPWTALIKNGDVVRLRFIGAGANTIFRVKVHNAEMQMIHVQGNDVRPYQVKDFTIAPGETYDVLVKIENSNPYIIYAESADTNGAAYGALITSINQKINYNSVKAFSTPVPVPQEMMSMMMNQMHRDANKHNHSIQQYSKNNTMNKSKDTQSVNEHATHDMGSHAKDVEVSAKVDKNSLTEHSGHAANTNNDVEKHPSTHSHITYDKPQNKLNMSHTDNMHMPTEPTFFTDTISTSTFSFSTPNTKYQKLIANVKTNNPKTPIYGVINMELFGYMGRYIWFINGKPEYAAKPYILEPGKRYRFVFTNNSMMHHPMHIHGHWFILRNGNEEYDPLLHTIDVAPGATIVADVDTDASGQWFFHCHMLYHMFAGMARVFQYSTLLEVVQNKIPPENIIEQGEFINRPIVRVDEIKPIDNTLVKHPMAHPVKFFTANFLDVGVDPTHNLQKITFKGLYGRDYNKLELFINDAEIKKGKIENADVDIFYWHVLDQFWSIKAGLNYFYRPSDVPYWQPGIGIEGIAPYFIDIDLRAYYHKGSAKFDLELSRDSQITNNFILKLAARGIAATKTVPRYQLGGGLNQMRYIIHPYYRIMPGLNVFAEYEYERNYGAFKNLQLTLGEAKVQNTITIGLSIIF